jgi:hypothetical protein
VSDPRESRRSIQVRERGVPDWRLILGRNVAEQDLRGERPDNGLEQGGLMGRCCRSDCAIPRSEHLWRWSDGFVGAYLWPTIAAYVIRINVVIM